MDRPDPFKTPIKSRHGHDSSSFRNPPSIDCCKEPADASLTVNRPLPVTSPSFPSSRKPLTTPRRNNYSHSHHAASHAPSYAGVAKAQSPIKGSASSRARTSTTAFPSRRDVLISAVKTENYFAVGKDYTRAMSQIHRAHHDPDFRSKWSNALGNVMDSMPLSREEKAANLAYKNEKRAEIERKKAARALSKAQDKSLKKVAKFQQRHCAAAGHFGGIQPTPCANDLVNISSSDEDSGVESAYSEVSDESELDEEGQKLHEEGFFVDHMQDDIVYDDYDYYNEAGEADDEDMEPEYADTCEMFHSPDLVRRSAGPIVPAAFLHDRSPVPIRTMPKACNQSTSPLAPPRGSTPLFQNHSRVPLSAPRPQSAREQHAANSLLGIHSPTPAQASLTDALDLVSLLHVATCDPKLQSGTRFSSLGDLSMGTRQPASIIDPIPQQPSHANVMDTHHANAFSSSQTASNHPVSQQQANTNFKVCPASKGTSTYADINIDTANPSTGTSTETITDTSIFVDIVDCASDSGRMLRISEPQVLVSEVFCSSSPSSPFIYNGSPPPPHSPRYPLHLPHATSIPSAPITPDSLPPHKDQEISPEMSAWMKHTRSYIRCLEGQLQRARHTLALSEDCLREGRPFAATQRIVWVHVSPNDLAVGEAELIEAKVKAYVEVLDGREFQPEEASSCEDIARIFYTWACSEQEKAGNGERNGLCLKEIERGYKHGEAAIIFMFTTLYHNREEDLAVLVEAAAIFRHLNRKIRELRTLYAAHFTGKAQPRSSQNNGYSSSNSVTPPHATSPPSYAFTDSHISPVLLNSAAVEAGLEEPVYQPIEITRKINEILRILGS
ncbi:hypothetical protein Cpir12675_003242 [Ceratocystis pirilliformis]|uniref:Uncharacterized protein n=1 Tax=Ceratocystis pirilliformis TaxID=259994 RepID=A0ABR3Z420_9PEZI